MNPIKSHAPASDIAIIFSFLHHLSTAVLWKQGTQSFGIKTKIHSDLNVILELSEHLDMPSSPARQQKKMNNELDQSLTNPDTSAALEFKRNDVVYSVPQKAYAPVAAEVVQPAVKDHNRNVSSDVAGYGQSNVACPPRKLTDIAADSTESKVGGQEETGQESEDSEEEDVGLEMHAIEPTEEDLWQGSMEIWRSHGKDASTCF